MITKQSSLLLRAVMVRDETLTLAMNALNDVAESKQMPSGQSIDDGVAILHENAAKELEQARGFLRSADEASRLMRPVMDAVRDLASGRKQFDDLTISTSEKLTVALAVELRPLPSSFKTEMDVWERLNRMQRGTVAVLNPRFQQPEWTQIPVYFG